MIEYLIDIDTQIFLALNGLHASWLDPVMKAFTGRAIWIPMYAAIAFVVVRRFGLKKGLLLVAVIGASVGLSDIVCAHAIRPLVERLRPAHADSPIAHLAHIVGGYRGGGFSFPSCHAANTVALAVSSTLIMRSKPYAIFICAWAALQCYSRIYLGVHYPFDLIAGAALGGAIGAAMSLAASKIAKSPELPESGGGIAVAIGIATTLGCFLLCFA